MPAVWIIILNWNGLADTLACLATLHHAVSGAYRVHILVVDNGSASDPRAAIAARFPDVEVVRLERNHGFTGGCNYGMQRALESGADFVVLLNNDTLVDPDFLAPLIDYLQRHGQVGVVGALICHAAQTERVWYAGADYRLALGQFKHRWLNASVARVPTKPFATGYVTGCCMALRTADLRRVGLFDERMFAYYEDAELCIRLRRQQQGAVCVPASRIWHKESASARRDQAAQSPSPLQHYLGIRNKIAVVRRHGTPWEQAIFLGLAIPLRTLAYLVILSARRQWAQLAWLMWGLIDGLGGRYGPPMA